MYGHVEPRDIVSTQYHVTVEDEVAEKACMLRDAKRTARRHAKERGEFCNGFCR